MENYNDQQVNANSAQYTGYANQQYKQQEQPVQQAQTAQQVVYQNQQAAYQNQQAVQQPVQNNVMNDPAYAQYLAAQKQAELKRQAELLEMQNRFMSKVYSDPKHQQISAQEAQATQGAHSAVSGDTLSSSDAVQANQNQYDISMEDIMRARFNEDSNTIQINFKKTCLIKAYETEVVEGSAVVSLNESMSGIERALAVNIIEAQVEQAVNENVLAKGLVTHYEYEQKKKALVETVNELRTQAIKLVGEEQVNKIFNM